MKARASVTSRRAALAAAMAVVLPMAAALGTAAAPGAALAQSAGEWASSAQLYRDTCQYCHDGKVAAVLLGAGLSQQALVGAVRRGPGGMPSFRPSELSDRELEQLAQWVRAQPKPAASRAKPSGRTSRHAERDRRR